MDAPRPVPVEQTFVVGDDDTALALGSGALPVLATPRLLAWMEAATCAALEPVIGEGRTSVGTRVDLQHSAASPSAPRSSSPRTRPTATGDCTGSG